MNILIKSLYASVPFFLEFSQVCTERIVHDAAQNELRLVGGWSFPTVSHFEGDPLLRPGPAGQSPASLWGIHEEKMLLWRGLSSLLPSPG